MSKKLDRKDVKNAAWTWMFFHHCAQNFERMQGLAFCHTMSKPLEKLYGDNPEELKAALTRHMQFFNTEPQLGSVIPGITIALEEARANGGEVDAELIMGTKNALMGPFAGIGDSILMGTYSPILLSIAIGLSAGGSPIGAIFFVIAWLGTVIPLKYFMFMKGYDLGMDAVKLLMNKEIKDKITTALTMVGLIVIGGVASTTVAAPIKFVFTAGRNDRFDSGNPEQDHADFGPDVGHRGLLAAGGQKGLERQQADSGHPGSGRRHGSVRHYVIHDSQALTAPVCFIRK